MSVIANIHTLSDSTKQQIDNDLEIEIINKFGGESRYINPIDITDEWVTLPFAYGVTKHSLPRPTRDSFTTIKSSFNGTPRKEQQIILRESIQLLNKRGSVMISAYPGFGKTCCSIYIAARIGLKTLVIVNKIVLMKQWEESVRKFCPSTTVAKLTAKTKQLECQFNIMNAQNVEKKGSAFFKDIGCIIVDEAHLIMAETLSRSLKYVHPRYLIGLTATPYRPDGLNKLLDLYFGSYKIIRKLVREHHVYKVNTGFKPLVEYAKNGRVNWGSILESQANDVERNDLIVKLIMFHSKRNILILVKRVAQGEYLVNKLKENNVYVTSLIGNNQEYDVNARVLIGTGQKVGTGFDHPKLDTLLLAADIEEYFIQYLGRVFRRKDVVPIILDMVDNYSILEKHYNTRRRVYKEHGGIVCDFNLKNINK